MEPLLVWYFLTSSVVTIGPFASEAQCKKFSEWTYRHKYVSECWQAPLAARQPHSIEQGSGKTSPTVR